MKFQTCEALTTAIADSRNPIGYEGKTDEYFFSISSGNSIQLINFCPFCGGKLPLSRRNEFFDTLFGLGIEYEIGNEDGLPEKFKTDKWWSERQ